MPGFDEEVAGAMFGHATGDAMGAPVEGWSPEAIADRFGDHALEEFLPPTHRGDPATGKGAGRVTDDTLMAEALVRGYASSRSHMDAYGYAGCSRYSRRPATPCPSTPTSASRFGVPGRPRRVRRPGRSTGSPRLGRPRA
jgi:ADP-ribosylglycohydrolase